MTPRKTTDRKRIQLVFQNTDTRNAFFNLVEQEKRSESQMGVLLIEEAIEARNSASTHSK